MRRTFSRMCEASELTVVRSGVRAVVAARLEMTPIRYLVHVESPRDINMIVIPLGRLNI